MKKFLVLILCLCFAISAVGCGKDDVKNESEAPKTEATETVDEEKEKTDTADTEDVEEAETEIPAETQSAEQSTASSEGTHIDVTEEELVNMADEFSNTTDPERKEELRQELQKILEQIEDASAE